MHHVCGGAALLVLGVLALSGAVYDAAHAEQDAAVEPGNSTVSLVVTTHNPACTAVHLDYLEVTRLTDVRPWYRNGTFGYTYDEITNGVNITAVIWARDSNMTIPSILERPEVSSISTYSYVEPNSTDAPTLLAQANNTDVVRPDLTRLPTECGNIRPHIFLLLMDAVGWDGAEPGTGPRGAISANGTEPESDGPTDQGRTNDRFSAQATAEPPPLTLNPWPETRVDPESGIIYAGDLMGVSIRTSNYTAVWAFLKENEALVTRAKPQLVSGYIPPSILWPLSMLDGICSINEARQSEYMQLYGNTTTEGLLDVNHPNVGQWHDLGHNGTDVKTDIINNSLAGIGAAPMSGDLPLNTNNSFMCTITDTTTHGAVWADDAVVEYDVFTYNPPCTAAYLDGLGAVTRITLLTEEHLYVPAGMAIRIQVAEDRADDTVQSLLERPRILSVQRTGPPANGSDVEWPVVVNPDATTWTYAGNCYPMLDSILENRVHMELIQRDQCVSGASGAGAAETSYHRVLLRVPDESSIASMVKYLKGNGAMDVLGNVYDAHGTPIYRVGAFVPFSLLVPLTERYDLTWMTIEYPPAVDLGSVDTRGEDDRNTDEWQGGN